MSFLHSTLKVLGAVGLGAAAFDGLKYVGRGASVAFDKLAGAGEAIDTEARDFLGFGEANPPLSDAQKQKAKADHDAWLAKNKNAPYWVKAGFSSEAEYKAAGDKIKAASGALRARPGQKDSRVRPKVEKTLESAKKNRGKASAVESAKRDELRAMRKRPMRRPKRLGPPPSQEEQMAQEEEGQTAEEIQSSRRLRQTSAELANQAEVAMQTGQFDMAEDLAMQAEQLSEAAIDPAEAEEMVSKSSISSIAKAAALSVFEALRRKGGDNIEKVTDDIREHGFIPDVESYGVEQDSDDVSDVVSGWEDEDEDAVGSGCGCGCGGTCGCASDGHEDHDHVHGAPTLRRASTFAGPSWNKGPAWRYAKTGGSPSDALGGAPAPRAKRAGAGLGGCKTGKCWLPK
jgi:hypothetical protein